MLGEVCPVGVVVVRGRPRCRWRDGHRPVLWREEAVPGPPRRFFPARGWCGTRAVRVRPCVVAAGPVVGRGSGPWGITHTSYKGAAVGTEDFVHQGRVRRPGLNGIAFDGTRDRTVNATKADQLTTARNINGVAFDGTKDITTDATTAEKMGHRLEIKNNGQSQAVFDGSAEKIVDITTSSSNSFTAEDLTNALKGQDVKTGRIIHNGTDAFPWGAWPRDAAVDTHK